VSTIRANAAVGPVMVKFLSTVQEGYYSFAVILYVPAAKLQGRDRTSVALCQWTDRNRRQGFAISNTVYSKAPDSSDGVGTRSMKVTSTLPSVPAKQVTSTTLSIVRSKYLVRLHNAPF
jgi:hypothetical protein